MKINKKYKTNLSEGHRPDLHPNGKVVRCVEDNGNGYLVVTSDEDIEPNTWIIKDDNTVIESVCPECGEPLIEKWSGVKCSKCEYWFCY